MYAGRVVERAPVEELVRQPAARLHQGPAPLDPAPRTTCARASSTPSRARSHRSRSSSPGCRFCQRMDRHRSTRSTTARRSRKSSPATGWRRCPECYLNDMPADSDSPNHLLEIDDLNVHFPVRGGVMLRQTGAVRRSTACRSRSRPARRSASSASPAAASRRSARPSCACSSRPPARIQLQGARHHPPAPARACGRCARISR